MLKEHRKNLTYPMLDFNQKIPTRRKIGKECLVFSRQLFEEDSQWVSNHLKRKKIAVKKSSEIASLEVFYWRSSKA
jgi:hypothetical protein